MSFHRPCIHRCALASIFLFALASSASAETTSGPGVALPAYPDESTPPSAYSAAKPFSEPTAANIPEPPPIVVAPTPHPVVRAAYQEPDPAAPTNDARRKLAPPSERAASLLNRRDRPRDAASLLPNVSLPADSLITTATALTVVVGLFLTCAWAVKRGQKKSNRALPEGVVNVLGRVPLAARQFAELVQVGNKLVLLSVTQHGVEPLTEVTDPAEIDRLLGLCLQRHSKSTTAEFDQVFRQLAEETAPQGFLGAEAAQHGLRSPADPFAAYRGGHGRA